MAKAKAKTAPIRSTDAEAWYRTGDISKYRQHRVARCVVGEEDEVNAEEIIDHCARNLAPYKVPRRIEFCQRLGDAEHGFDLSDRQDLFARRFPASEAPAHIGGLDRRSIARSSN